MERPSGKGRIVTFDIEAIGLLDDIREGDISSLHIIHVKDKLSGELFTFFDDFEDRTNAEWLDDYEEGYKAGTIRDGILFLRESKCLIIQNGMGYDFLAFEKAAGKFWHRNHFQALSWGDSKMDKMYPFATMDTYVMSCTLNPERKVPQEAYALGRGNVGPHSIEAHGIRIGRYKPEHEDWSHLSIEMIHRVEEDVEIGEDMYDWLMREDWKMQEGRVNPKTGMNISNAYWCELRMARTVALQAQRGFAIDVGFIADLLKELDEKIQATFDAFSPHMPKRIRKKKLDQKVIDKTVEILCEKVGQAEAFRWESRMDVMENRGAYHTTKWDIVTKKGQYAAAVTKIYPEARGFITDHQNPLVAAPFTPVEFEDIPLGNREEVKKILFENGWRGVNFNDSERDYIEDNGELPKPWSGKIDDDSLEAWKEREGDIPEWCEGIAAWYVLKSRRTQILNIDDPIHFQEVGSWPRQTSKKNECRGILPRARYYADGAKYGGETAQDYFEREGKWPTTGHWRVPAIAFHAATNTFRMRHKVVVNIPSRGLYGHEMRRMFIAGPGKMLLGCDGAGLELRMLSHFMADAVYQDTVLNGDIHTYNQELAGLPTRDMAKTFIYAFLYGSGIPNLAAQLGLPESEMAAAVDRFKRELPQLAKLLEGVEAAGRKFGYLMSVDGRWGRIRRRSGQLALHTALNVLLQMTGSLTMKWAHINAEDQAVELGVIETTDDFPIVAHVHDEAQMEVDADQVEENLYWIHAEKWKAEEKEVFLDDKGRMWSAPKKTGEVRHLDGFEDIQVRRRYHPLGDIYCQALTWAGEHLKLRCPTAGEYMIGDSWAETH